MLAKLIVVTIPQYIHVSNHCLVHLKQIQCYLSTISQSKKKHQHKHFRIMFVFNRRAKNIIKTWPPWKMILGRSGMEVNFYFKFYTIGEL